MPTSRRRRNATPARPPQGPPGAGTRALRRDELAITLRWQSWDIPRCGRHPDLSLEKQLQKLVTDMARGLGWLTYHTKNAMQSDEGFPDLVCVHLDRGVLFLELKVNAPVTSDQEMWVDTRTIAKQRALIIYPEDAAEGGWLERVLNGEER